MYQSIGVNDLPNSDVSIEYIKDKIISIVSRILHHPSNEIKLDSNFSELGADSIAIVEISRDIGNEFSVSMDASTLYGYPTIEQLAHYIQEKAVQLAQVQKQLADASELTHKIDLDVTLTETVPGKDSLKPFSLGLDKSLSDENKSNAMLSETNNKKLTADKGRDIAIIGMSGRFPDANDVDIFWKNLVAGVDSVRKVPKERWDVDAYYDPDPTIPNKTYNKVGAFVPDVDKFDPLFFNISPKEAELMDPTQRLFLEEAWKAIEDAGYARNSISNTKCGVFVGAWASDYSDLLGMVGEQNSAQSLIGTSLSILAARISYFLNLKGPSLAIDTACSSSLVAIHLACESLLLGESDIALAGGVAIMATPRLHILCSKLGMLSHLDMCRPLDQQADGIVLGEGVGVVVLKPLHKAIEDRDNIYGVIKASGINQDGATNGITAPNPEAQTALQVATYKKAGINPEQISYIELHGTGTPLGDPMELSALTQSFRQFTNKVGYCGIGSVKTNIGHTTMTAGVASVIKVLLALKHKKIPAHLHFNQLSEHINLENSPFYLNTKLKNWDTAPGIPRQAAVSSFGFSGTNAHLVIEEAPTRSLSGPTKPYYLCTLSAKTDVALKERISGLATWLNQHKETSIEAISYTLNVGRTHFEKRCIFVVTSTADLHEKLLAVQKDNPVNDYLIKTTKSEYEPLFEELLEKLQFDIQNIHSDREQYKKKLLTLGNLYVKGMNIDFTFLHLHETQNKISLPTYPFAKERYWVSGNAVKSSSDLKLPKLHPLIDENVSTLETQRFRKTLDGKEFYLSEHHVNHIPTLVGVVYLEMARVAAHLSAVEVSSLQNIMWMKPIQITEQPQEVNISLYPQDASIDFEVITGKEKLHAQGKIVYGSQSPQSISLDLLAIKNRCVTTKQKEELYAAFDKIGLQYGPHFQVIESLWGNDNEVLSKLSLQEKFSEETKQFVLHPGILDGALQTTSTLIKGSTLYLPFSIASIEIYEALPAHSYVHAVIEPGSLATGTPKFQIQIADEKGKVVVAIKDFILRALKADVSKKAYTSTTKSVEVYDYVPIWEKQELTATVDLLGKVTIIFDKNGIFTQKFKEKHPDIIVYRIIPDKKFKKLNAFEYLVNLNEPEDYLQLLNEVIENNDWPKQIIYVNTDDTIELSDENTEQELHKTYYAMLYLSKALIRKNPKDIVELSYINMSEDEKSKLFTNSLSGFSKTLHLEHSKLACRIVSTTNVDSALAELKGNEIEVHYDQDNNRYIRHYKLLPIRQKQASTPPLKHQGVYLITGGAGGLGMIFARYLAQNYQAKLALIGRSALSDDQMAEMKLWENMGAEILYARVDITKLDQLKDFLVNELKPRFGEINGVIHAAGILKDAYIIKKTEADSANVLAPKIYGALHLDELTQNEPLDFFVLCSSISAALGNVGQSDYAYANGFLDAFAFYRDNLRATNLRQGKTISIDWTLWAEGGMRIDDATLEQFKQISGMKPLKTSQGIQAFLNVLEQDYPDQIILTGRKSKLTASLNMTHLLSDEEIKKYLTTGYPIPKILKSEVMDHLKNIISDFTKINPKDLEIDKDLMSYGIDSIVLTSVTNRINKHYRLELRTALLFEYKTIHEICQYLIDNHSDVIKPNSHEIKVHEPALAEPKISTKSTSLYKHPGVKNIYKSSATVKPIVTVIKKSNSATSEIFSPVSFVQEQLWLADKIDSDPSVYNLSATVNINGFLDEDIFEKVLNEILSRHDILRASYIQGDDGKILQSIKPAEKYKLDIIDLVPSGQEDQGELLKIFESMKMREARKPFNLTQGPLTRFKLFKLADNKYVFLSVIHHISSDGKTFVLILNELIKIYEAYVNNRELPSRPKLQYSNFARIQHTTESKNQIDKDLTYWAEQLKNSAAELSLPFDKVRPNTSSFAGDSVPIEIENQLVDKMNNFIITNKVTMFMFMVAALNTFFLRYTQQEDISIGCATANRPGEKYNDVFGCFLNVIVLRTMINKQGSFEELLQTVKKLTIDAMWHQSAPFEKVVEVIKPRRELNRTPLFEVLFLFQNVDPTATTFAGLQLDDIEEVQRGITRHSLVITLNKKSDGTYKGVFTYSKDLFERETILRMTQHFKAMLESILETPSKKLFELNLLTSDEINELLKEPLLSQVNYIPAHLAFAEQAALQPKEIAFSSASTQLTYSELNSRVNQLAAFLIHKNGVKQGDLVAVCLERSEKVIISILAILKAGAAFVPLDPTYPKERLGYILSNTNVATLVTETSFDLPDNINITTILNLDDLNTINTIQDMSRENVDIKPEPNMPAYVIFTSGSTGLPKGVIITQKNLAQYILSLSTSLGIRSEDRYLHTASFSFSSSVRQMFLPLVKGSRLVLASKSDVLDPSKLFKFIKAQGVTIIDIVPSYWRSCIDLLLDLRKAERDDLLDNDLRLICTASEPLYVEIPTRWIHEISSSIDLINMFGQTETTGISCVNHYYKANSSANIPTSGNNIVAIGKPISCVKIFILDNNMQLLPKGIVGEIYIAGSTVGNGYHGNQALTAKHFIKNPFSKDGVLFKSGDLGEIGPDGSLEFIGRKDYQVKIRGFRVELGEIESIIKDHNEVKDAIVITREEKPGDVCIIAYWIPKSSSTFDVSELREHIKNHLPDYMIPSAFVKMSEFPLTLSGKLDRKALPAPNLVTTRKYTAPRDALEYKVAKVWSKILNVETISIADNFFEIGGNSLTAIQLISALNKELEIEIPATTIFTSPNIETMADVIRTKNSRVLNTALVPMQPAGNGTPIFAFHAVGGNVFCYAVLAQLMGKEQPFYGLQQATLPLESYTLEDMATRYIKAIKEVQPQGPYQLIGWCIGGILANEIAYQLEKNSDEVSKVVIMDSYLPEFLDEPDNVNTIDLIIRFAWDLSGRYGVFVDITREELEPLSSLDQLALLSEKSKQAGLLSLSSNLEELQKLFSTYKFNLGAAKHHHTKVIKCPIVYFNATLFKLGENEFPEEEIGKFKKVAAKNIQSWSQLTTGGFNKIDIEGSHYSMLSMPEVEYLTHQLKGILYEKKQ